MNNFGEANNTGSADTAVIPSGTVINGNISITDKLEIYGEVNGNINSGNRVDICGDIIGNIKANDLYAKDSYIVGQIDCAQDAVVHEKTVILGDINAENLVIDGAVQGRLDIRNNITVGGKAIMDSDIKAKTIQVTNGAVLNGHCSTCYADETAKDFFSKYEAPEAVSEPVPEEPKAASEPVPEESVTESGQEAEEPITNEEA